MNIINGFRQYICPFCYEHFTADQVEFRASDHKVGASRDEKLSEYYGFNVNALPIVPRKSHRFAAVEKRLVLPRKVKDSSTGLVGDVRVCPECHNPLPTFFEKMESKIISVVGARSSGKTHFITVLIDEIRKHGNKLGLSLFPQDVGIQENEFTTKRYKRNYWEPLFGKKEELKQTNAADKDYFPLIYELRSNGLQTGRKRSLYLVFYDTAGETFQSAGAIERQAKYVANSSGIIFLFDSFQVPYVGDELRKRGYGIPPSPGAFHEVLDQVNQLLEQKGLAGPKKKSKVPFALTFSKVDALIKEGLIPSDMVLAEPSHHERYGTYSQSEASEVSEDIQSMLYNWDNAGFVNDMEAIFQNHSYFGVSALGSTPAGGRVSEIKPHRILDPLLWILDRMYFPLPKVI